MNSFKIKSPTDTRLMLLGICSLLLLIFYFIRCGFDLNDEGYYFQGYLKDQAIFFSTTGFHLLVRLLPFSDDVIVNRCYRVIFHLAGSFFLFKAAALYFKMEKNNWECFFWILLGSLASYVYAPNSFSYNTLNLFFLEMGLGLFLILESKDDYKLPKRYWYVAILLILSLMIFNKASTGFLFFILLAVFHFVNSKEKLGRRVGGIVASGLLVLCLSFFWFYLSFGWNFIAYFNDINNNKWIGNTDHQGLAFHLKQLLYNPIYHSKKQFLFVMALMIIFLFEKKYSNKFPVLKWFTTVVYLAMFLLVFWYYRQYYACGSGAEIFTILMFFLVFVSWYAKSDFFKKERGVLLFILVLPLIGFSGSNVSPFEGMNHYLVFYFLIIYLLNRNHDLLIVRCFYFLTLVFIAFRFVYFPFENPPLNTMNLVVDESNLLSKLYVSKPVHDEVKGLVAFREMDKFALEAAYLGINPGTLYLSGLRNYGTIYYNSSGGLNAYLNFLLRADTTSNLKYVINKHPKDIIQSTLIASFILEKSKMGYYPDTLKENENYLLLVFFAKSAD